MKIHLRLGRLRLRLLRIQDAGWGGAEDPNLIGFSSSRVHMSLRGDHISTAFRECRKSCIAGNSRLLALNQEPQILVLEA